MSRWQFPDGKSTAVLLSAEDCRRLTAPKLSFIEFMRSSPLVGVDLKVRRSLSTTRRVERWRSK
jgi:hypothetical protein